MFRIVQESLNNVAKHAKAKNCSLTIRNGTDKNKKSLVFFVTDDGIGFDTTSLTRAENTLHFGLQSMKSRADLIGAKLEISSAPDDGTEIRLEVEL